jgi:alginate O-acetyltransferase complex protein AlgI
VLPVFQNVGQASTVDLVLASYLWCFQIYCDFSGYTDMATGLARVLGIKIMVNFRRPYFSTSISEFWGQRWHVSLTRWMRDYLYIPLGGSRVPKWRQYFNTYVVFAFSGLWHGAAWGYVIWGVVHGTWMAIAMATHGAWTWLGKLIRIPGKVATVLGGLAVWHMHMLGAIFFVTALVGGGFKQASEVFTRIFKEFTKIPSLLVHRSYSREFYSYFALLALLLIVEVMEERWNLWERIRLRPVYVRWAMYYAVALVIVGLGIWRPTAFIYQSF